MRPESLGRVLGIGLRVAGRVAAQRINAPQSTSPPQDKRQDPAANRPDLAAAVQNAARARSNLGRGLAGFLKPFGRVGSIVWLEVTGVFFFLPVLVFAPTLWRTRFSYIHGPDHRTFVASAIVVVLFFYLGVTSFWRARRK
jgi:hypothetical protein